MARDASSWSFSAITTHVASKPACVAIHVQLAFEIYMDYMDILFTGIMHLKRYFRS